MDWSILWDVISDALLDTLKLLPFLFLLYLLIEILEHNTALSRPRMLTGKAAPVLGAALGTLPMCGFSVMAAKLYSHRHITAGTLVAVFIATSDEALLVLLLSEMGWAAKLVSVLSLILSRFALALVAGYAVDAVLKKKTVPISHHEHGHEHHEHGHERHEEHGHGGHVREETEEEHEGSCECDELSACEHRHENKWVLYLLSPLGHALQVAAFVLAVNLVFGLVAAYAEEALTAFLQGSAFWAQPVLCALIGAIPNCASSVVLAETYALGAIGFGGLLAGLIVNAGLGYAILLGGERRRGLIILGGMLLLGIAAGYAAAGIGLLI